MKINLQGPFFLTQLVARWMAEQKKQDASYKGCIVNISSISSTVIRLRAADCSKKQSRSPRRSGPR